MRAIPETSDGLIVLRAPQGGDVPRLVAGRDALTRRFLGPGSDHPAPTACITVDGRVAGWVDYDVDRAWLTPGEVNLGYSLGAPYRGKGLATRAVRLLLHRLAVDTAYRTATVLIDPANRHSLALAQRVGFVPTGMVDGSILSKRPVPPLAYTDGVVTIRRQAVTDLDADLEAKDDAQMRWMWLEDEREQWASMSDEARRAHALAGLRANRDSFGAGPKWTFAVDAGDAAYVAYVDCDLANEQVTHGEANVSYSSHPSHRGRGHVSRAVRLVVRFLADHTGARQAHLIVDAANTPSLRVACAVGAVVSETWRTNEGATMVRHMLAIRR